MPRFSKIHDQKLRKEVEQAHEYTEDLMAGRKGYSFRKLMDHRDDIAKRFEKYIKRLRKEIKENTEGYDTTKKEVSGNFKYDEQNIISTFERNVIRAFGQAAHSIEKALDEPLSAPGFFGTGALYSLIKKKPKAKDLNRVEGFSRLNKNNRIYRMDLIPYIIMLIATAQDEWGRRLNESIAVSTNVDLGYISPHPCWLGPQAKEVCNKYRGKIMSIFGLTPNFPRLEDAKAENLFHPHCTHSIHPLTREEEETAIARRIKTYSTLKRYA